jgi:hypothetical protein
MSPVEPPVPEIEVPVQALRISEVAAFQDFLTGEGEMSPREAEGFTRALLAAILVDIGEWCARVTKENVEAVLRLRVELKLRYVGALRLLGEGRRLPEDLQPEAFREIYLEMARRMDDVVAFDEQVTRDPAAIVDALEARYADAPREVPPEEARTGLEGVDEPEPYRPPDEPPGEHFDDPEALMAEEQARAEADDPDLAASRQQRDPLRSYNRDLTRVLERFGDVPRSRRRAGAVPAPTRANAEAVAAELLRDFLAPAGVDRWEVHRQPILPPHMAAENALGVFDPVRATGYEIAFRAPADLTPGRRPPLIKPDGWAIFGPDSFELLEHKAHETIPPDGFFGGESGRDLLYDLELRGRMAQRLPGCRGWRYSADLPQQTEVLDWTIRTLRGEHPATRPEQVSPDFAQSVGVLAADPTTRDWAQLLRMAP